MKTKLAILLLFFSSIAFAATDPLAPIGPSGPVGADATDENDAAKKPVVDLPYKPATEAPDVGATLHPDTVGTVEPVVVVKPPRKEVPYIPSKSIESVGAADPVF